MVLGAQRSKTQGFGSKGEVTKDIDTNQTCQPNGFSKFTSTQLQFITLDVQGVSHYHKRIRTILFLSLGKYKSTPARSKRKETGLEKSCSRGNYSGKGKLTVSSTRGISTKRKIQRWFLPNRNPPARWMLMNRSRNEIGFLDFVFESVINPSSQTKCPS